MVEVHYYDPFNFTLLSQDEVWGNQHCYWGVPNQSATDTLRNSTWGDEVHTDTKFGLMKTKFVDQGIPVILGEFASMRRDVSTCADVDLHLQSRRYYHQYVVKSAVTNGMRPFFWDVGAFAGGVFDRANNTVADPAALTGMQQGALGIAP
jgi:endoglucanase